MTISSRSPDAVADRPDSSVPWATSSRFVRVAILCIGSGAVAFLLALLAFAPHQQVRMVGPSCLLVLCTITWVLQARGRMRAAIAWLVIGTWILLVTICVFNGGVRTPAMTAFAPLIIMAGWLMGVRTAGTLAVLTLAASLGLVVAEGAGALPAQPPTSPLMFWAVQAAMLAASAAMIAFFLRNYRERIAEVRRLSGNLARLEAEAAVAETVRRSNYLLDRTGRMARVGGWELDVPTRTLTWTTEVFLIHELPPGPTPQFEEAMALFAPPVRATLEAAARDAIEHGRSYDLELPLVTAGGRDIWVRMIGEPQWVDGTIRRLGGTVQDITEQRAAAQALQTSVENLHRTLESIGEGIFAYDGRDPSGRLLFANDEVFRIWNIPLEEAPQTGRAGIITAARRLFVDPDAEVARIEQILATPTPHEDRVRLNDGRVLLRRSAPILGNGGVSRVWTFRDVTREEQALAALQEREEQLRHAQEIAHLGSFDWYPVSGLLRWSDEHFRLWGLAPGAVTPDYALFRAGVHPQDVEELERVLQAALAGGTRYACRHRVIWPDGTVRVIQGLGEVMLDADGRAVRMLGTVRDITELQAAEAALIAARDEAEAARREADAANAAKSEFLSNMSHEIRTPLNAVLGLAQVGQRETQGTPVRRLFDQMLDSGQHLLGIINNVLDFSKIEAGKLAVTQEVVHLQRLVDRLLGFCAARAAEKGLALRVERGAEVPQAFLSDFLRLSQVLSNLLDNAIKFTAQGEVLLAITVSGDRLRFQVRDSGIGMSAEQMQRVFLPFEQADGSTTRRFGGTGLGLGICKRLVEIMGGTIQVESRLGAGALFTLDLPLVAASVPADAADRLPAPGADADAPLPRRLDGMRILVAEDNPVNQTVLRELLEQEGARLVCADDGREALAQVEQAGAAAFDIVLTDIQMPRMDGHALARALRERAPQLPIVGLTAHAFAEERQRCFDSGMVDHVTKPVELHSLVHVLRMHTRWPAPLPQPAPQPAPQAAVPPAASEPSEALVDWAAMLARYRGQQALVDKLAVIACSSEAATPASLREAAAQRDFGSLAFQAHRVKGVSANLCAESVNALALRAELAARAQAEDAPALALQLAELVEAFLAALAARHPERSMPSSSGNTGRGTLR